MLWHCPACGIQIQHSEMELTPRAGHRYRCHVCRLELVTDDATGLMTVAPIDDANDGAPKTWDRVTPPFRKRR
jgi:rubredoxin